MSFDHLKSTVHKFNAIKPTVVSRHCCYWFTLQICYEHKKPNTFKYKWFFLLQMQCRHLTMQAPFHSANFLWKKCFWFNCSLQNEWFHYIFSFIFCNEKINAHAAYSLFHKALALQQIDGKSIFINKLIFILHFLDR